MKLKPGDQVIEVSLPAIDGTVFNSDSLRGRRYMISFFRFASCPFCNLRVHQLINRLDEMDNEFEIVAIFDSPLDNLQKHAEKNRSPFPMLADEKNTYYREYGIEHSLYGMLKGIATRLPALLYAMFIKGYLPFVFKGSLITLPADFLVNENGTIEVVHYGKDEGDHLPVEIVIGYSRKHS